MQLSNTFFIKVQKTRIKFITFFIIAIISWFILVPNFTKSYLIVSVIVATVCTLLLTVIINASSFQHIANVFKCLFKWSFYKYLFFMFKEIVLSTYDVLKHALMFSHKYHSQIIIITLPKNTPVDKTLLVMISIILTPGTTVIDSDEENLTVHCLTKNAHNSMQEMTFVNKVLSFNF